MKNQFRWIVVFLTLLLVMSLACNAFSGDDEADDQVQDSSSTTSEQASDSGEPDSDAPAESSEPDEEEASDSSSQQESSDIGSSTGEGEENEDAGDAEGPVSFNLGEGNNFGLPTEETSYRVRFSMDISITDGDEETEIMNIAGEGAVSSDPPATSFDFQVLGVEGADTFSEMSMIQIDNATYFVSPLTGCISGDFGQDLFEFDDFTDGGNFVGGVDNAQLVEKNVDINGVNTDHYAFDPENLDGSGAINDSIQNFQGDLYVSDDGYVVRIEVSGDGSSGIPGLDTGAESHVEYQLDYFDVGAPVEITVPDGCDSTGGSDLPIVSDATDLFSIAGITTYHTNFGLAELIDFYKTEMEAEGWTFDSGTSFEFEESASLSFQRDGSTVSLIISEDEALGGHAVVITEQ